MIPMTPAEESLFEASNEVLVCGNTLRNAEKQLDLAIKLHDEAKARWDAACKVMNRLEQESRK